MAKTKDRCKWQGVSLPVPFINMLYEHIKDDDTYRSIADFVRVACREKVKRESNCKHCGKPLD